MSNDEVEPKPLAFTEIPKIVDEIAETEGAQAADDIASSDLDDLELVLGDLEVGSGESDASVIEHLDELDAYAEDKAKAERQVRKEEMLAAFAVVAANAEAAAKAKAREAQEPTPELNEQTCGLTLAEAPTDIASSDLEDLELVPGDLEVGAGETDAEVIESLDELFASDTANDRTRVASAAMLADLQRIIDRQAKTFGEWAKHLEVAADAPDDQSGTEVVVHEAADSSYLDDLDLEVGNAEFDAAVIESLRELDAYAKDTAKAKPVAPAVIEHLGERDSSTEAAVENLMAREEAYEDQPDEPTARTVAMQEYKARQPKRGAPRPAACKEFSVDPTDPLAVDKVRIAYKLKGVGKTLADLEKYHPGFWALPLETDGRDEDDLSFPSRKLVLSRFLWNRETETERQKKREAKIAAKGWPANYHDLPPHQQRTIRNRLLKRKSRERAKA